MAVPVIMPKLEMSQETATVIEWIKRDGERVDKGEPVLAIETDKVTVEVESPASGILAGVRVKPQQVVPVTEIIAFVLEPGEELPETPEPKVTAADGEDAPRPGIDTFVAAAAEVSASPVARRVAQRHGIDLSVVTGSGPGGRISREDVAAYLAGHEEQPITDQGKVRAAPAARRLARELGVELAGLSGSGPRGRIQSADVRRADTEGAQRPTATIAGIAVRRRIPLTGMRRSIAERMVLSVREAPQFTVEVDVKMSRALGIVEDHKSEVTQQDGPRVTLTAFLVKACSWALARHPALNAAFEADAVVEWAEINIGVAVAVQDGLIVPILHNTDCRDIHDIALGLADLAARARSGQLRPQDVAGGTFTVSNLGMYGVDRFSAILNPPQAGILAVGRVSKRPVVDGDQVAVAPGATLTLTADHRIVDGVLASQFLAELQNAIERPGVML